MHLLFRRLREFPSASPGDSGMGAPSGARPTLEIAGEQRMPAPTDEQIRMAVGSLDACTTYAFLILDRDVRHSMEVSGDAREGFEVEYYDGTSGRRYRGVGDFGAEQVIALLIAYRSNAPGWQALAQWEQVDE